jgi:pyruvate kinase
VIAAPGPAPATSRAKIVCTLGPATSTAGRLAELVAAGLDVARLNLSHGSHAEHQARYSMLRSVTTQADQGVAVLADLQGPKIRLGRFAAGQGQLAVGADFAITTADVPGSEHEAATTYRGLPDDVRPGDRILIDDGRVVLMVTGVKASVVRTTVVVGGSVSDHKGLNLPRTAVSIPALTRKDQTDLRWALRLGADLVALSFVRRPDDAKAAYAIMDKVGIRVPLIAKIEKPEAVAALPEILSAFDGIMVARGDLGVELPLEQVPLVQKRAIALAREQAKPVIVATQMLESMISAPRPTRAEASDVANAVIEGADAVMLSAETSVGAYPVDAVSTMARIIAATEQEYLRAEHTLTRVPATTGGTIARAAAEVGALVGARAIVAFTMTGATARRLARYRSPIPLLAFTPEQAISRQLALTWGVQCFVARPPRHTDDMVRRVEQALLRTGSCVHGDKIVLVAGSPPGIPGRTNALRVHQIGDAASLGRAGRP